jgi:hypothetical protein
VGGVSSSATGTRAQHKSELRAANAAAVRELVQLTGTSHAAVNGELNRLSSISRITEATVRQLDVRLRHANAWLARLTGVRKS